MIRAVQGPPLTDSKDSQTFRTDTKSLGYGEFSPPLITEPVCEARILLRRQR